MKKVLSLILVLAICLSLCACGKSEAAKECESLIAAIGDVSINSKDAIVAAERAYSALTAEEKDSIAESAAIMNEAIDAYYIEFSKEIYSNLNSAHEIVDQLGSDLYAMGNVIVGGITFSTSEIEHLKHLLDNVNIHLTEEEFIQGIDATVEGHDVLDSDYPDLVLFIAERHNALDDVCLKSISNSYKLTGRIEAARSALYEASVMMTELNGVDACAKHQLILEKYYAVIDEFLSTCLDYISIDQILQFNDMSSIYQGYVETYKSDLDALFSN